MSPQRRCSAAQIPWWRMGPAGTRLGKRHGRGRELLLELLQLPRADRACKQQAQVARARLLGLGVELHHLHLVRGTCETPVCAQRLQCAGARQLLRGRAHLLRVVGVDGLHDHRGALEQHHRVDHLHSEGVRRLLGHAHRRGGPGRVTGGNSNKGASVFLGCGAGSVQVGSRARDSGRQMRGLQRSRRKLGIAV